MGRKRIPEDEKTSTFFVKVKNKLINKLRESYTDKEIREKVVEFMEKLSQNGK